MAFSSLVDARSQVTNPTTDVNSTILYGDSNILNITTTFYTNPAKTILASAGNYVVLTNYKSYYITIGGNGKMTTSPQELMNAGTDVTFVDDSIMNYSDDSGQQTSNNWYGNFIGGVSYSLNTTTLLLTDDWWYTQPYSYPKKWVIDNGTLSASPVTNINLSAMKGYDLIIRSGEWNPNSPAGFTNGRLLSSFIHIAPEVNRTTVVGKLNYYFRPDYLIPTYSNEYPSFFRRMPNALPIVDRNGYTKEFMTLTNPLLDMVIKDSGQTGVTSRTFRNPTRQNKGLTKLTSTFFRNMVAGQVSGINSNYVMKYEDDGSPSENIYQVVSYENKHLFDADSYIRSPTAYIKSGGATSDPNYITDSSVDASWCCALLESLLITNPSERATWTFSNAYLTISYASINPYQWTTVPNVGTNRADIAPATQYLGFFNPNGTVQNPFNLNHGAYIQHDAESVVGVGRKRINVGRAYDAMAASCKAVSIANNWPASGAVFPKFSIYGEGIYQATYYGSGTAGWLYVDPSVSVATVKTTDLYSDYHNYYINGTISRSAMINYNPMYEGCINSFNLFFVTNYCISIVTKWYFYNAVHGYDISKKIIAQIGSEISQDYSSKRVQAYSWRFYEPIPGNSDFNFERKGVRYGSQINWRPTLPPSFIQSLAVWAFGYMDGLYMWDNPNVYGGEFNHYPAEYTLDYYRYGNLDEIDNSSYDWLYIGYWQIEQNRDIVSANTAWVRSQIYWNGAWTSDTDANNTNYPVMLYNRQAPISAYKLSADGTEALLIITNPFNNGYTKETFKIRLQTKGNQEFDVDVWGNFTTVIRLKSI